MNQLSSILVMMLAALPAIGQQTFVIPVVTDETPGLNDSTWVTEVQVIKRHPHDSLTVRRVWVCTADGGFLEEVGTALTWEMTQDSRVFRMLVLSGKDLLEGTGELIGAVALEVAGGEAIVNARIADVSHGVIDVKTPFGQGQRVSTDGEALEGPSHFPWLGGCQNNPCTASLFWDYHRVNLGFVNPNPEPLTITATAIPFGYEFVAPHGRIALELLGRLTVSYEAISVTVPAYGWLQFPWKSDLEFFENLWGHPPATAGFIMTLEPDSDAPYHAYSSTVFSPDPSTGVSAFNDPMFVPASPGIVEPFFPEPE